MISKDKVLLNLLILYVVNQLMTLRYLDFIISRLSFLPIYKFKIKQIY